MGDPAEVGEGSGDLGAVLDDDGGLDVVVTGVVWVVFVVLALSGRGSDLPIRGTVSFIMEGQ